MRVILGRANVTASMRSTPQPARMPTTAHLVVNVSSLWMKVQTYRSWLKGHRAVFRIALRRKCRKTTTTFKTKTTTMHSQKRTAMRVTDNEAYTAPMLVLTLLHLVNQVPYLELAQIMRRWLVVGLRGAQAHLSIRRRTTQAKVQDSRHRRHGRKMIPFANQASQARASLALPQVKPRRTSVARYGYRKFQGIWMRKLRVVRSTLCALPLRLSRTVPTPRRRLPQPQVPMGTSWEQHEMTSYTSLLEVSAQIAATRVLLTATR
jgi:hypothetical protein